ncbi:MAG: YbjQ family protein [Pseudomonadota bacterium]
MEIFASELFWQLLFLVVFMVIGYSFGTLAERRHYRSIRQREAEYQDLIVITTKTLPRSLGAPDTALVRGSVVVSVDYFKRFLAFLRMIVGGRLQTYESLVDRGRREALLRLQAEARKLGADKVFCLRLDTSSISKGAGRSVGSIEVLAYGTAVIPSKSGL